LEKEEFECNELIWCVKRDGRDWKKKEWEMERMRREWETERMRRE
jgi:hypothetical protein